MLQCGFNADIAFPSQFKTVCSTCSKFLDPCLTRITFHQWVATYLLTYIHTYLLTNSMVQSPSSEANLFTASQEIPHISQNSKVHYRTHKRPPTVSILGQPNPVHIPTSHLLEIHPNIIHPSTPRSPQWSPSFRFPTKTLYTPSLHPYAPHAQPSPFFTILSPAQYL